MSRRFAFSAPAIALAIAACNIPRWAAPSMKPPSPQTLPATIEAGPQGPPTEPAAGAAVAQLSASEAASPSDTLRVVYTDRGDLWLRDDGEAPRRLTHSGSASEVRITTDGELIAYVLRDPDADTAELRSIRADGTGDRVLLTRAHFDALYDLGDFTHYTLSQFQFAPQTHTLLFNTRGVFEGPGVAQSDDLLSMDAETGDFAPLLAPGAGGEFTFSADGSQVAIVRPDGLSFSGADGGNLRPEALEFAPVMTYSEYFFYPRPVWAQDGSYLLMVIPAEDPFASPRTGTIWRVHADGATSSESIVMSGDFFRPQGVSPILSPDLSKVAFFQDTGEASSVELVIADLSTEHSTVYDRGSIQWRGWAPGSERFVYSKNGGMDLQLGQLGRPPQPLAEGMSLRWVSEQAFLFVSGGPGDWSLKSGRPGEPAETLAEPGGDRLSYDFAWIGR